MEGLCWHTEYSLKQESCVEVGLSLHFWYCLVSSFWRPVTMLY
jgi:hypothetical protein